MKYEGYKSGIFIHTSNKNGFAGVINGGKRGITVGCLLISPSDWQNFNDFMSGVKNVKSLSFTQQLRDFYLFSQENNLQMILYTRSSTTLSGPLNTAIQNGQIIHRFIPGN